MEYLTRRSTPDAVPVPASWTPPPPHTLSAAVTLRSGGNLVARVIASKDSLPLSVASAAMAAMRSEKLPDRVTAEVLAALTVEVEIIISPDPASEAELSRSVCGLTGLQMERAGKIARVLPSQAYEEAMDRQQMRSACLMKVPLDRAAMASTPKWFVFRTRHFVAVPGQPAKELFRGKVIGGSAAAGDTLAAAAADYLIRHQAPGGAYRVGDEPPPLREHLAATLAMARLNARGDAPRVRKSVNAAMAYVARQIKRTERTAYVVTVEPADQLAATAYTAMIIAQLPPAPQAMDIRTALLAAIAGAAGKGEISCRLDSTPAAAGVEDLCLAYEALKDAPQSGPEGKALAVGLGNLARQVEAAPATDAWAQAWKAHAGLPAPKTLARAYEIHGHSALLDRRGGIGPVGGEPLTALTGLCVSGRGGASLELSREQIEAARRFCAMQMYKGIETYVLAEGEGARHGVRACPASAEISVGACAAAMEAFLSE